MNQLQALGLAVALIVVTAATILHNPLGGYRWDDGLYATKLRLRGGSFRKGMPTYEVTLPDGEPSECQV